MVVVVVVVVVTTMVTTVVVMVVVMVVVVVVTPLTALPLSANHILVMMTTMTTICVPCSYIYEATRTTKNLVAGTLNSNMKFNSLIASCNTTAVTTVLCFKRPPTKSSKTGSSAASSTGVSKQKIERRPKFFQTADRLVRHPVLMFDREKQNIMANETGDA